MNKAMLGAMVGAGIVAGISHWEGPSQEVFALPASHGLSEGRELVTLVTGSVEGGQQLVVVDPRMRAMASYRIDPHSGGIVLKSVRNFKWDLELVEFNGTNPRPQEVRAMVEGN